VKLAFQRAHGDCGIAALASLLEQPYEDVFVEAAKVEKKCRGRNGIYIGEIQRMAKALGVTLKKKPRFSLEDDEGLLIVKWLKGSRHDEGVQHLVAVGHGVIVDPADGTVLPPDEYLAREQAHALTFLEMR
jgi:hypothetical protein